ncbi:TIGR02099 family protein [Shewanella sp. VB17]|nr:TIGR02099 family protein [Shewanella sp. VB17]
MLFALVISLFRALLPQLDQIRAELINYIEFEYQVQVDVGELTAKWQALGPELTIRRLTIPSQEHLPFTLLIDNVHVKLDFWQSIISVSPQITRVIFDGVQVALDIDKVNNSALTHSQDMTKQVADTDWIYRLLLEQLTHFSIHDASLQLLSVTHEYRPIYVKDLTWMNSKLRHQGHGKLYLDEAASEVELLSLQLDIVGSGYKPDSLQGQVYLAARSLDLGKWASRQTSPYDSTRKLALEGVINLEAWFDIAQRNMTSAHIEFEPSWLEWQLNEQEQHFEVEGGRMLWVATDKGWRLKSQDLAFQTNQKAWPKLELTAEKNHQVLTTTLNRLDTSTLLPLLPLIPTVDLGGLKKWQLLEPKGYVNEVTFSVDDNGPQLAFGIEQLSWQHKAQVPGVSPFDMSVAWQKNSVYLSLPKQKYVLDFGSAFKQSLALDGEAFNAQYDLTSQALALPSIELNNPDIAIEASMRLNLLDTAHLALLADVKFHDVSKAVNYFPLNGMSQELVEYLETGLVAGKIQDAKVLYNGALSGYPYQDHSGIFQTEFTLEEAEFEFQPDWPSVTSLNLSAVFENDRMDLLINKGQLLDVVVDGANIVIPQLGERSLLQINADLLTQGEAATQVLNRSPLADQVGSTLNMVQIQGQVSAKLDLDIPLYEGEKERIHGLVNFDKTPVYIAEPGLALEEVTGQVEFLDDVVTGKGIEAILFEQAVSLTFDTKSLGDDYGLDLQLSGAWALENLPDYLDNPLKGFYSGELSWEGDMSMIFEPTGYQIQAKVSSDLLGVNLALPDHFAKKEDLPRQLTAEFTGNNKQSSLGITLGEDIDFLAGFDEASGNKLAYFDLMLGRLFTSDDHINKDKGRLQLSIDNTKFTPWLAIINQFTQSEQPEISEIAQEENERNHFFPPLISIDGEIAHLDLMGQPLTHLNISAKPIDSVWRFEAESDEFDGRVDFYPDWSTQGLKLVASKLHLSPVIKKPENAVFKSNTVLKNLPPLAIDVDEFSLYGKPLGHLVLQGTPQDDNYHIQTVSLTTPSVTFVGNGTWNNSGNENVTEFNVKLDAAKFDDLSAILGMDPGLKDAPLAINGKVSWQGGPYAFSLGSLNGLIDFKLGKGHLSEVSDKGARLFSLFSLDSLLRKLSLDFSDVFGKGLYFDTFTGTLDIDHGVIKTHNTEMDAVAGNMKVRGYTDLMTESLHYDIRFVPQLASSVPTVVLLTTGGWTFGLGAFALTKVLEPVIEVITELRFRLTGTMSAPKLEELARKSKEIVIPESVLAKVNKEPVDMTDKKSQNSDDKLELDSIEQSSPNSGVELPKSNVEEIPVFKDNIKKEVKDADQSITMPK